MAITNEFERDLTHQAQLKRPGRVDLIVFQNVADAGDGSPGIQRCFRNYLHEGGMEKDLELVGYGIKGTSVDINNAELQQLSNIGAAEISGTQWGYVGGADQAVKQTDSPTFAGLSLSPGGAITSDDDDLTFYFGRVAVGYDGAFSDNAYFGHRDNLSNTNYALLQTGSGNTNINAASSRTIWLRINNVVKMALTTSSLTMSVPIAMGTNSITGTSVNINNAEMQQLSNIGTETISGTQWGYLGNSDQNVRLADSPTFVGLSLSANLVTSSTIDGVDVSVLNTNYTNHAASTSNPHTVTAQQAFTANKTVSVTAVKFTGANNSSNALVIGAGNTMKLWYDGSNTGKIYIGDNSHIQSGANIYLETNSTIRWYINSSGHLQPYAGDSYDIGSAGADVSTLYYCNLSETSCADFSDMSADEIYNLFAQIKPRTDDIRHKTKDMDFKHIDFTTLPNEFASKADEDFTKENMWKKVRGKLLKTTIDYKKGDNAAIEMTNYIHALRSLAVKSYEKIIKLEKEMEVLKNNNKI